MEVAPKCSTNLYGLAGINLCATVSWATRFMRVYRNETALPAAKESFLTEKHSATLTVGNQSLEKHNIVNMFI